MKLNKQELSDKIKSLESDLSKYKQQLEAAEAVNVGDVWIGDCGTLILISPNCKYTIISGNYAGDIYCIYSEILFSKYTRLGRFNEVFLVKSEVDKLKQRIYELKDIDGHSLKSFNTEGIGGFTPRGVTYINKLIEIVK